MKKWFEIENDEKKSKDEKGKRSDGRNDNMDVANEHGREGEEKTKERAKILLEGSDVECYSFGDLKSDYWHIYNNFTNLSFGYLVESAKRNIKGGFLPDKIMHSKNHIKEVRESSSLQKVGAGFLFRGITTDDKYVQKIAIQAPKNDGAIVIGFELIQEEIDNWNVILRSDKERFGNLKLYTIDGAIEKMKDMIESENFDHILIEDKNQLSDANAYERYCRWLETMKIIPLNIRDYFMRETKF